MTPDLDAIRAALAAATPPPRCDEVRGITHAERVLVANAPTWLAALCDEVERLRAERGIWSRYLCTNGHHTISRQDDLTTCSAKTMTWSCHAPMVPYDGDETIDGLVAERDAALAECERLRHERLMQTTASEIAVEVLVAERDAALAERDEWRARYEYPWQKPYDKSAFEVAVAERDAALADNAVWVATVNESAAQRKAWRACADQLAAHLKHYEHPGDRVALAEYERLKGAES